MAHEIKGSLNGSGLRIGIIVSQFNEYLTAKLLQGALSALQRNSVPEERISVAWVPGSLELPQAARHMALSGQIDALVALGAVVRGETAHFDYVAGEAARGIAEVTRDTGIPVAFGVLTTDTIEQATDRAGGRMGNRGYDAAVTALQMANLLRDMDSAFPSHLKAQR